MFWRLSGSLIVSRARQYEFEHFFNLWWDKMPNSISKLTSK
jgi:hypothetical protein